MEHNSDAENVPRPDPHGCDEETYGLCVWGCLRPGCREFPSPFNAGPFAGVFMCWSCGKYLARVAARIRATDIKHPDGHA